MAYRRSDAHDANGPSTVVHLDDLYLERNLFQPGRAYETECVRIVATGYSDAAGEEEQDAVVGSAAEEGDHRRTGGCGALSLFS